MKRGGNRRSNGLTGDKATLRSVLVSTSGQAKLLEIYQVLPPAKAAEFLGLALQTVRNMTSRGELTGIKHGTKVIGYSLIDLIAWLDAHKSSGQGPCAEARAREAHRARAQSSVGAVDEGQKATDRGTLR